MSSPIPSSSDTTTSSSSASIASDSEPEVPHVTQVNTKCSLCHDTLRSPRVLHCFHSFCQTCLEKQYPAADKIVCPICRAETYLDYNGVSGLLPDFAVNNVLDVNNSESAVPKEVYCTGCKGKQSIAVAKCFNCVNYLCPNCVQAHQLMHCFAGKF